MAIFRSCSPSGSARLVGAARGRPAVKTWWGALEGEAVIGARTPENVSWPCTACAQAAAAAARRRRRSGAMPLRSATTRLAATVSQIAPERCAIIAKAQRSGAICPDLVQIRRALISCSDKDGLLAFATFLSSAGVELLSTGGTAAALREAGLTVKDVSEVTGFPEILSGRVKTLHPLIHGGILAVRSDPDHTADMASHDIEAIDLVVSNLYAFEETVASGADYDTCVENIDIGGPSMIRAAAKNHAAVVVCSSPAQYGQVMDEMRRRQNCTSLLLRKKMAAQAFAMSAQYEAAVSGWFQGSQHEKTDQPLDVVSRNYRLHRTLKYGVNPHQTPASIYRLTSSKHFPFEVVHGNPGYINLMDAVNAWQLVAELRQALDLPAAASFKHVSPAGAAVAVPLSAVEKVAYDVGNAEVTPLALAYIRARNADPMCSFGDFAAVSDVVDEATARILSREVSDGIIAKGFDPKAREILSAKKGGAFVLLAVPDGAPLPPSDEYREIFGVGFHQRRNNSVINSDILKNIVTKSKHLPPEAVRDLIVASITLKYTQSNSVGYAKNGQMIGVGAGQQSRVDCVKLAGRKAIMWSLRQHPKVLNLKFKPGVKRSDKVNARVRYLEGDITAAERPFWEANFSTVPTMLSSKEKDAFIASSLDGVSISSDAFFPFRDSIDHASMCGVKYLVEPGGSNGDEAVIQACNQYGMTGIFTGIRLFHH